MSLKILVDDQIEKLFSDNPELSSIKKINLKSQLHHLQT